MSLDTKIKPASTNLLSKHTVPALLVRLVRLDVDVKPASTERAYWFERESFKAASIETAYLVGSAVLICMALKLLLSKQSWLAREY